MVEVKFHDIGEGMTEGEIVSYLVKIGDEVKADQALVEMQTDKMVAEIPSPTSGVVKHIHYDTGTVVTIGSVLLEIDDGNTSNVPTSKQEVSAAVTALEIQKESTKPAKKAPPKRIKAAPHTRRIARENNVDIEKVVGTGPSGRIIDEDIYRYMKEQQDSPEKVTGTVVHPKPTEQKKESDTIPFKGIRKQIAEKMTTSVTKIPHVTHHDEVDLTNLLSLRQTLKESGENISVVAFFLKALAITLKEFPLFNAQLDEEKEVIQLHKEYHIGLATNTEQGLLVPVLQHVDQKSLRTIQTEMKQLTKKAQEGKLTVPEMQGGTFTISNVGPLGGTAATPIINYPQTAIIAFHKTKKTPIVMPNDEVEVRSVMTMSLSFDHRVMDGADAVMFTNRLNELVEEPSKLMLELG